MKIYCSRVCKTQAIGLKNKERYSNDPVYAARVAERRRKYLANPEAKRRNDEAKERWYLENRVRILQEMAEHRLTPEGKRLKHEKYLAYYSRPETRIQINDHVRERRENDIQFRLSGNIRARIRLAVRKGQKAGSAVSDLGCTVEELKKYLEAKFQPGMTWENWGRKGWHIDHIIPLASFDLTDREQFLKACHYTNLQPLWADQNLVKGAKFLALWPRQKVR